MNSGHASGKLSSSCAKSGRCANVATTRSMDNKRYPAGVLLTCFLPAGPAARRPRWRAGPAPAQVLIGFAPEDARPTCHPRRPARAAALGELQFQMCDWSSPSAPSRDCGECGVPVGSVDVDPVEGALDGLVPLGVGGVALLLGPLGGPAPVFVPVGAQL